ncbi:MAG: hypothetical protein A2X12_09570 [Bacteroidetes bacterium GWE2_29_8]|nr:MAG: hypothetical protein A2X12_09570 [Bacteroidetes bacterium GWE2_29_8]OFY20070.1 MAG: hypothetical protein A2X02_06810 [Bacteroidetes bacterium GWF2_29_10]
MFISLIAIFNSYGQNTNIVGVAEKYLMHDKDLLLSKYKSIERPFEANSYRPVFDEERLFTSKYFVFHYTTKYGLDSVSNVDADFNGLPDYVEDMAMIFDSIYNTFVRNKFTLPPSDGVIGGDSLYDVYIGNLDAIGTTVCGFVLPEDNIGDNNMSKEIETDAWTSFMCMRNDYSKFAGDKDIVMKVTSAHEFMHAIQLGYAKTNMSLWFKEMTAVWAEDLVFPGLDDNLYYLKDLFFNFDIALNLSVLQDANGKYYEHWYGTWLFAKYITEHTSDTIINNIYKRTITYTEIKGIDDALALYGSSFKEMQNNFYIANVLLTNSAQAEPYTYERGKVYYNYLKANQGGLGLDGVINFKGIDLSYYSNVDGNGRLMRMGADYISFKASKSVHIVLKPETKNTDMELVLLKINFSSGEFALQEIEKNTDGYYSTFLDSVSNYSSYIIIVKRFDKNYYSTASLQYEIYSSEYPLSISENVLDNNCNVEINCYDNCINMVNKSEDKGSFIISNLQGSVVIRADLKGMDNKSYNLPRGMYIINVFNVNNECVKRKKALLLE